MKLLSIAILCGLLAVPHTFAADLAARENEYYKMITIPIPEGIVLEAGALQWMPNGRLAVSTRLGDIFLIEDPLSDPPKVNFTKFASGLHEVLGLALRDGDLYATQRGEVTRIKDKDQDGRGDLFQTVGDLWHLSGDYHEYAFGSKFDPEGNIWVVLCLTGSFSSEVDYRGWCIRVNADGTTTPTSSGIRSPGGIGTNYLGDMFYTDNQGPWNGTSALKHLKPGAFVGHPGGNKWYNLPEAKVAMGPRPADPKSGSRFHIEAKKIPQYIPPTILFPYNKMGQSASGVINDSTGGKFGPFKNQLFVGDQTHSTVMRVYLEQVNGVYQGALFPFRQGHASGTLSFEFAPDGSLFVGGTDRGWGSRGGKPYSLQRLVWTGKTPFEIHEMRAKNDGFEFTFTEPIDPVSAEKIESWSVQAYTYIFQESYGSPEVDHTKPVIRRVSVSDDKLSARVFLDGIQEGHIHEFELKGIRSVRGEPLLHKEAYYTLNQVPAK